MNTPAPPISPQPPGRTSAIDRFLIVVERGGNALPHPATLFALLAVLVVVLSWVTSQFAMSVQHPTTGEIITPVNLMSIAACTGYSPGWSPTSPVSRRWARCWSA